jgi:hypothetical protein
MKLDVVLLKGGQGIVYMALCKDKEYALKVYYKNDDTA